METEFVDSTNILVKAEPQEIQGVAETDSTEEHCISGTDQIKEEEANLYIKQELEDMEEDSYIVNPTTNSLVFPCTKCNITYTTPFYLERHHVLCQGPKKPTVRVEPEKASRDVRSFVRTIDGVKRFCCGFCEYTSNNRSNIRRHIMKHTAGRDFKCEVCEKTFTYLSHLVRHRRTHAEFRGRNKCLECGNTFTRASDLKRHSLIHTGEKIYACRVCEYRTGDKGSLVCHMRVHTGEKPFSCPQCKYKAKENNALKIHIRARHTDERPYACGQCEYRTAVKSSLNAHMKRMHENQPT